MNTHIIIHTSSGDLTLRQIAEITGIPVEIVRGRYYHGFCGDALMSPIHKGTKILFRGELLSFNDISKLTGVSAQLLRRRYERNKEISDDELAKPASHRPIADSYGEYIGKRYGDLKIIDVVHGDRPVAICECACGNVIQRKLYNITSPKRNIYIQSCGCSRRNHRKHGLSKSKEHKAWRHIKERCLNPNSKSYANYGGRGITVCDRWKDSFENFYADMGPCPNGHYSIDRINNDKGYSPDNCRWADSTTQTRNRRNTIFISHNGEIRPLTEWASIIGIKEGAIRQALRAGKDMDSYLSLHEHNKSSVSFEKGI